MRKCDTASDVEKGFEKDGKRPISKNQKEFSFFKDE